MTLPLADMKRCNQALVCFLVMLVSAPVFSQGGDDNLQLIDQTPRQNDRLLPVQAPGFLNDNDTFQLPPVPDTTAPAEPLLTEGESSTGGESSTDRVLLNRVVFKGNTVVTTAELDAVTRPYIGKKVSVAEIEFLRQQLTRLYIEKGYINSGLLLASESAQGVVTFNVIEGKLQAMRISGAGRLRDSYIQKRLQRNPDEPLNMEVLRENYQLLLNDSLIEKMNARLLPGTEPGQAILDVDVTRRRPWQFSVFVDNYRSAAIGEIERGFSGSVQNLTGFGDLLEGVITESPQEKSSVRGDVAWRMPLNSWGTDLTLRYEKGQSTVTEKPLDELQIDSLYETREAGLSQVLYESMRHRVSTGISYAERDNETYLLGEPFSFIPFENTGKSESIIRRFWQEYTWRSNIQVFALRSTFSNTSTNLKDPVGSAVVGIGPDKDYDMWIGQFVYVHKVMENGAQVSLRGMYQDNQDRSLPTDDFVLGGLSTIRGYRENQFVFDTGHMLNLEFDYPLRVAGRNGLSVSLKPFVDYGVGENNPDGKPITVSSTGLALNAACYGVTADLVVAKRLSHPDMADDNDDDWQDKGVEFRLAYNF